MENVPIDMSGDEDQYMIPMDGSPLKKVKIRCKYWPTCKRGDACVYFHPIEQCANWPNCSFGSECWYIHPQMPCKYGVHCNRPNCVYTHPPANLSPIICKFGENCSRPDCVFTHSNKPLSKSPSKKLPLSGGADNMVVDVVDTTGITSEDISGTLPSTPPYMKNDEVPAI